MQTDRRLVENVQNSDKSGTDLGRKPDSLGLTAGQCTSGSAQSQVTEADILEEFEAGLDLLGDHPADLLVALAELAVEIFEESHRLYNGKLSKFDDILASDGDCEDSILELVSVAYRAELLSHHV